MNETVKQDCIYKDCKYRGSFDYQPCCIYMLVTGEPRGCKISECNKYKAGKVTVVSHMSGMHYKNDI